ncbi:histidine phosphatase family protein [Azonexus sp. IMCC34839]|uniref:histidine phosphatase family protein n=1 Tax=Azonexus sp. IMCC34839 TaxID=3133695 RepID=UPI00399BDC9F
MNLILKRMMLLGIAIAAFGAWAADPMATAPSSAQKFAEVLATPDLLKQLRNGGYVLYLRHGQTDNARPDRFPSVDLNDCSTQRPLTEEGRKQMLRVGEAVRKAGIPLGEIRISPLCRVRESTAAAFPASQPSIDNDLMYTANLTSEQKVPILTNTRRLLSEPVPGGRNRLLVAHAPNLMDLIGYFPKEATLVVFRPLGVAGFDYVASIPPSHWAELQH